ncbi:MAG: CvpA family protein [Exilibacterium sp.]
MDISLIVFLCAVAFCTYSGYRRGLGASLARILGLVSGYAIAIVYTDELAVWLQRSTDLQGIASYMVAGIALFLGGGLAVSLLFGLVGRFMPKRQSLCVASSLGGAATGLLVGCVIGFALVWGLTLVRQLQPAAGNTVATRAVERPATALEKLANRAASGAVAAAAKVVDAPPDVVTASRVLAQSPGATVQRLQRVVNGDGMKTLLNDSQAQRLMQSGDSRGLLALPAFQQVAADPDLRELASSAGFTDGSDEQLAARLSDLWRRAQRVKQNPQLQQILHDPELQQQLQSGNPLALLSNPKVQTLLEIIYSSGGEGASPQGSHLSAAQRSAGDEPASAYGKPASGNGVFRWVDNDGRVHYSDKDPQQ